jgi:integrase
MPWRKYSPRAGRYGPIYPISRGTSVRKDARGYWVLFFEKQLVRKNQTYGKGRRALVAAIKAGEEAASERPLFDGLLKPPEPENEPMPDFFSFCQTWFKAGQSRWAKFTIQRYTSVLAIYIEPEPLFRKQLDQVRRQDVKEFLRRLARKRSPALVETVHGVISAVFNEAVDEALINANPVTGILKAILPPKNQRDVKPPDPFTQKELGLFLDHARSAANPAKLMVLRVMAYAGLRLGEALAMRAEYFDSSRRTYFVAQSYRAKTFRKPKIGKTRLVDLPDFLVDDLNGYINSLRKESLKKGEGGRIEFLFIDPAEPGHWPYSQRKIQYIMGKVCRTAHLRTRNPHELRHTFASLLLMAHQSPGYVQRQLGHSSISITMDIYCHWLPGQGRGGLEAALVGERVVPNRVRKPHIIAYEKKKGP